MRTFLAVVFETRDFQDSGLFKTPPFGIYNVRKKNLDQFAKNPLEIRFSSCVKIN